LIAAGGAAYYYLLYLPAHPRSVEVAYVLSDSAEVMDTPAEVRLVVGSVRSGERVGVLRRTQDWVQIEYGEGRTGWVGSKDLLDSASYEGGQKLYKELGGLPAQAAGHSNGVVNLRLGPSRDAVQLAQLPLGQKLEVFGRRLVGRPPPPDQPSAPLVQEAWYLVRVGSRAGWVLGRFVELDIPAPLSVFAQSMNIVAWLTLNTVNDEGRQVPQYLIADRMGSHEVDFNHIRVFTWWLKRHEYVTAYAESGLTGYFPIRVTTLSGIPYFRLRLIDSEGRKVQKVYGLFDTITRSVGIVDGWESDALPAPSVARHRRRR
jgi:hypothetical protein